MNSEEREVDVARPSHGGGRTAGRPGQIGEEKKGITTLRALP